MIVPYCLVSMRLKDLGKKWQLGRPQRSIPGILQAQNIAPKKAWITQRRYHETTYIHVEEKAAE